MTRKNSRILEIALPIMDTLFQVERIAEPSTAVGALVAIFPCRITSVRNDSGGHSGITCNIKRGLILGELYNQWIFCELFINDVSRS